MFTNLLASAPRRRDGSSPPALGLSTVLHVAVVLSLVWLTARPVEQRPPPKSEAFTFVGIPEEPAPVEPAEPPPPAAAAEEPAPQDVVREDAPAGYQVLGTPAEIPGIPEPGKIEIRAEDFTGRGVLGGLGNGRKLLVAAAPRDTAPELDAPLSLAVVDQPPRLKNVSEIRMRIEALYPQSYHMAGVESEVVVEVVVDPAGRPEREGMKIVGATREGFEDATRALVALLRFEPARRNGRAVRVWIQLPISWTIEGP
jgi:periplasmic protein TonB